MWIKSNWFDYCSYRGSINIKMNANSNFSVVTKRWVSIIFFELGVVKNFMQKF